ncbi:MAG: sugar phosphate nucleotidyltransferase [Coriobacteriia bacterium]|nr:sugar phosphate nucleotidyltransferase [Coriobacteriia bacterium]MCL2749848.1 sugar phosphate nucleotidyltransferase [Coriobacteriia bacterium]
MRAIIPAAGKGTRFLPASKAVPKEMLPVLDKPAIQYVVEEALAANASEVVIICNDDKPEIAQHFSPDPALVSSLEEKGKSSLAESVLHAGSLPVSFAEQPEALGLGHAVHCAASFVSANDEGFYVLLGDVLVPEGNLLKRMRAVSKARGNASVIAVMSVPREEVSRFGIIDAELTEGSQEEGTAIWQIRALVEKPTQEEAPSNLAIFGRYLLTPAIMQILAHTAPGAGGEIQLTDAMVELLKTEDMYAVEVGQGEGFDCGTIADWLSTNIRLAAQDAELAEAIKAAGANLC